MRNITVSLEVLQEVMDAMDDMATDSLLLDMKQSRIHQFYSARAALRAAMEQLDPAPYLYYDPANGDTWTQEAINDGCCPPDGLIALYTGPHRTPLTDERIDACFPVQWEGEFYKAWRQEVGRAIERAHGIGGKE